MSEGTNNRLITPRVPEDRNEQWRSLYDAMLVDHDAGDAPGVPNHWFSRKKDVFCELVELRFLNAFRKNGQIGLF